MTSLAKVVFTATNEGFQKLSGFPVTPLGWKPPPTFPYEFIQLPAAPQPSQPSSKLSLSLAHRPPPAFELETDVVIVGSGCGAGVCAKNLAEAGWRVLVLDKGYHFDSAFLPMASQEHLLHMIDGAGAITSTDNSILVVAGSCFGGGGTVNWSASLRTQGFVRDEWADERGLTFFKTGDFDESLNFVCEQMGVHTDFTPNHGNQILLDGAEKLGWSAKKVPQNTGRNEHHDGHCAMGCSTGDKKGPVHGWFPDAANAGAKFMEGAQVQRVIFDKKKKTQAVGVEGTWTSRGKTGELDGRDEDRIVRKFTVKARRVIVSSGTLWSPIILMNSGLKVSNSIEVILCFTDFGAESKYRQEFVSTPCQRRDGYLPRRCPAMGRGHPHHGCQYFREPRWQRSRRQIGVSFHDGMLFHSLLCVYFNSILISFL